MEALQAESSSLRAALEDKDRSARAASEAAAAARAQEREAREKAEGAEAERCEMERQVASPRSPAPFHVSNMCHVHLCAFISFVCRF